MAAANFGLPQESREWRMLLGGSFMGFHFEIPLTMNLISFGKLDIRKEFADTWVCHR